MAGALQRRNFRLLWGGQFVSDFGRQLTIFAFPTIAILGLHARVETVTAVTGSEYAVIPLFAMVAGLLIDRWRRRHTMILANLVRLTALASVPLAAAYHVLTMPQLIAVATLVSLAGLFFDTAYQPFLVTVVGREHYERGNARMTLSAQAAAAFGNAFGGPLVSLLGAPLALATNVATYLLGTAALLRMRSPEARTPRVPRSFRRDLRDGVAVVAGDPQLRVLAAATSCFYFGGMLVDCLLPLYAYRVLHLSPLVFGCALAAATLSVAASGRVARCARAIGAIPLLCAAAVATAGGDLLCLSGIAPIAALVAGRAIVAIFAPAYEMTLQSFATSRTTDALLGRMNAALRTLTNVAIPVACFSSGALAHHFGFAPVMASGAFVMIGAAAVLTLAARGTRMTCSFSTTTTSALPSAA